MFTARMELCFIALGIKCRAMHTPDRCSMNEPWLQPWKLIFVTFISLCVVLKYDISGCI